MCRSKSIYKPILEFALHFPKPITYEIMHNTLIESTQMISSIGLPRVNQAAWEGEIREYSPYFLTTLLSTNPKLQIFLEQGYGKDMGYSKKYYESQLNGNLIWTSKKTTFQQDLVLTFKYPFKVKGDVQLPQTELEYQMRPNTTLISMIHYPSRSARVKYLKEINVNAISLDSIMGLDGRTVYDKVGTSQAGVRIGYELLRKVTNAFSKLKKSTIKVVILGGGGIGSQASLELHKYNRMENEKNNAKIKLETEIIDKEGVEDKKFLSKTLRGANMLVDAAYREDPTSHIVSKAACSKMATRIFVDLAGDNYYKDKNGKQYVKAVEGVKVLGEIDQLIFYGDFKSQKPLYPKNRKILKLGDDSLLSSIKLPKFDYSKKNIYVVSCGSWPGTQPGRFRLYEKTLSPLLNTLLKKDLTELTIHSEDLNEKELSTGLLSEFVKQAKSF